MELLKHFKELSLHPANAKELKGLILQLAVQGKLTAKWRKTCTLSEAEGADILLKKIKAEKEQLIKDGKIKREKPLPEILEDEIIFKLPTKWELVRITELASLKAGGDVPKGRFSKEKSKEYDVPIYANGEKNKGLYGYTDIPAIIEPSITVSGRGTIGYTEIRNEPFYAIVRLIVITPFCQFVDLNFLKIALQTTDFTNSGTSIPQLTVPMVKNKCIIYLPPLAEQKAIVSTVDQLFAEVEQLEQLTQQRIQLKEQFATSALQQLSNGSTQKEWAFLQTHFHDFFNLAPNIKKLRESILQLAVQGKLTAHWRTERTLSGAEVEAASELLEKIKAEKAQLIKAGKIKKEKLLPTITQEEIPYELPEGWVWCRIKDLGQITGGGTPSKGKAEYWDGNILWVSPKDMKSEYISDSQDKITIEGVNNSSTKIIPMGSLLIVGRSGILKRTLPVSINTVECAVNQDMKVVIPFFLDSNTYLKLAFRGLEDNILRHYVKYGMTVHSLKYSEFELMPIPLPPLEEQKAIVQKVNSLMALCDSLEQEVQQSNTHIEKLMKSVLREVFEDKEKQVKTKTLRKCDSSERAILAGHIINLTNNQKFGRVKFQKLLHLAEYHCRIDLSSNYIQKVAGPYDGEMIREIESTLKRYRYFTINKKEGKVDYVGLGSETELDTLYKEKFTNESEVIDKFLSIFKNASYDKCEIVSTLYAVWNNRIIKGQEITDDLLIEDFLEWDKQKAKYKNRLAAALDWMKKEEIIPRGWGKLILKAEE